MPRRERRSRRCTAELRYSMSCGCYHRQPIILSSRQGRNVPQTIFGLENALIMPGSNVHDCIIQVMADKLAYEDGDLYNADKPSYISCFTAARTIGVPYAPAMAYWENPYPSGGGDPRKTALVT
jgi:hypothetical protein